MNLEEYVRILEKIWEIEEHGYYRFLIINLQRKIINNREKQTANNKNVHKKRGSL